MASYKVNFDSVSKNFDSQFPIFLNERGVTSFEYQETIRACSMIAARKLQPLEKGRRIFSFATMFSLVIMMFFFFVPMFIILFTNLRFYYFLPIGLPVSFLIWIVVIITLSVTLKNKSKKALEELKSETQAFLETENQVKYLPKGIQILLKVENQMAISHSGRRSYLHNIHMPYLEIILSNGTFTSPSSSSSYPQSQPFPHQQQTIPPHQQYYYQTNQNVPSYQQPPYQYGISNNNENNNNHTFPSQGNNEQSPYQNFNNNNHDGSQGMQLPTPQFQNTAYYPNSKE